uniref:Zona pellucida binding protein 2 n=1 Tax=Accipiter nisus TaxID=211598 RepID=A0A8B9MCN5_9AVES
QLVWNLVYRDRFATWALKEQNLASQRQVGALVFKKRKHFTSFTLFFCIAVKVYVKVFTNSPFLVCMDLARSREEVIDPKYLWIGPDRKNLEGQMYVNLTKTGKLMVMGFKESMSGAYTCTLSHKIIETTTQEERVVFEAYKFMVYVNPFAPGWEEVCHQVPYDCEDATNMRVQEARERIGEFFNEQTYALKHEFQTVPTIHYVDNSFSVTHIDSCRPGFGKNDITHKNCASCCVVCEPGTYSPNNEVTCQICTRPRVKKYGARSC